MNIEIRLQLLEYTDKFGNNRYRSWLKDLDIVEQARIQTHVDRLSLGLGDVSFVGSGILELRLHFGGGYRIYFVRCGRNIFLLLCGGNKRTQGRDIRLAKELWLQAKNNK